jgi:hypothetical protein
MPAEDGLGLDDEQTQPPASPQAGKPDPEDPVSPMEPGAHHRALEDGHLLAERQVLGRQCGTALEEQPEEDRDDLQRAHCGSRLSEVSESYRVARSEPAIGKSK